MNPIDQAIRAAIAGNVPALRRLLDDGVPVSVKSADNQSLLAIGVRWGHTDIVRLLLDCGADVSEVVWRVYTMLDFAVAAGNKEITGLLIDHGARPDAFVRSGYRQRGAQGYYAVAIENNQPHQVIYLEGRGWEPFDAAALGKRLFYDILLRAQRQYEAIDFLINRGAEPWRGMWRIPDVADRLIAAGRTPPADISANSEFPPIAEMTPNHPLWPVHQAIDRLGPVAGDEPRVRAATLRERASLASFRPAPQVLEFFSHFVPTSRSSLPGFTNFDGLMLENADFYSSMNARGFFTIGGDGSGDAFFFGPRAAPGKCTPPIYRVDHEIYDDDMAAESLPESAQPIAEDIVAFLSRMV
jgi:hypothetical protein